MRIRFLGTGASEGVPALFCQCEICRRAREIGGREQRTRCQAIINDEVLVDFGPDTYMHLLRYGIDITELQWCLLTHAHSDHLYVSDLEARERGFAILSPDTKPLTVFGSRGVGKYADRFGDGRVTGDGSVMFRRVAAFEPFSFGGNGTGVYTVIPAPAIHSTEEPLVYAISANGKSLLYAHDTDVLPDLTLARLRALDVKFDLVTMDCTEGKKHIDYRGHMNFERDREFADKLCAFGLAGEKTVFVANHFSHNGRVGCAEAVGIAEKIGFTVAYDGLEIEF